MRRGESHCKPVWTSDFLFIISPLRNLFRHLFLNHSDLPSWEVKRTCISMYVLHVSLGFIRNNCDIFLLPRTKGQCCLLLRLFLLTLEPIISCWSYLQNEWIHKCVPTSRKSYCKKWGRRIEYSIGEWGTAWLCSHLQIWAFQVVLAVKNLPANAGDVRVTCAVPGSGRSAGGGHDNTLQYSCLEVSMDRGGWQAAVHSVTQSQTMTEVT